MTAREKKKRLLSPARALPYARPCALDPAAQGGQANDLMAAFDLGRAPSPPLVLRTRTCP
jgi:hypothetical protein